MGKSCLSADSWCLHESYSSLSDRTRNLVRQNYIEPIRFAQKKVVTITRWKLFDEDPQLTNNMFVILFWFSDVYWMYSSFPLQYNADILPCFSSKLYITVTVDIIDTAKTFSSWSMLLTVDVTTWIYTLDAVSNLSGCSLFSGNVFSCLKDSYFLCKFRRGSSVFGSGGTSDNEKYGSIDVIIPGAHTKSKNYYSFWSWSAVLLANKVELVVLRCQYCHS